MAASNLEQVLNYSNASNFSFDSSKIEFVGSVAKLKLQEAQEVFSQDYANDTGFTYDSSLAEFTGGKAQALDQTPTNAIMYSDLTSKDLNWRTDVGSLAGTLNGSPTFSASGMACTGSQGTKWTRTTVAEETLLVKYQPNYTGTPPTNINIIGTSGTNNDRAELTHSPSADSWRVTLYDNGGTQLLSAQTIGSGSINLQSDTIYHLALTLDSTNEEIKLYVKAGAGSWTLHGTITSGLSGWARGGISEDYIVGADPFIYDRAEGEFSRFSNYDTILDPVSSAPTDPLPSKIYLESKIDLPNFTFSGVGTINTFDSLVTTDSNSPRYIIDGKYWNGSNWVSSDGSFSQANIVSDINTNIGSFPADGLSTVTVSVVFGDSNSQMSVDQFDLTVSGDNAYPTDNPTIINNSGVEGDALESFAETTSNVSGADDIKYTINVSGQDKYWDGAAWSNSDGSYAQANTPSEIETNKAALDLSSGGTVKVKAFLHSDDGTTTPDIETITLGYNFFNTQSAPATCTVWGFYRDISGSPVEGATVTATLKRANKQYREAGDSIVEQSISTTTDSSGRFEMDLIRTSEFETAGKYELAIAKSGNNLETSVINADLDAIEFEVPDASDVNITDQITAAS